MHIEKVELERPQVSYFRVFNAKQVEGFPELDLPEPYKEDKQMTAVIDHLIDTSECRIYESNQGRSYYSVTKDEIHLPDRRVFKSLPTFASVLAHEMSHATGAAGRLARPMGGVFGSPEYGMPTFWKGRNLIHFVAQKKHIGLYPGAEAVGQYKEFLDELKLKHSKGAIQIPYDQYIPVELIHSIAEWCLEHNAK